MPRGDLGVRRTLQVMGELVTQGVRSPLVIQTARSLIAHLPEKDTWGEAQTVFQFVKNRVRYTKDPVGVELLRGPERMIQEIQAEGRGIGDCDELTTLLAALLRAIGIQTRFRVVSFRKPTMSGLVRDSRFSHVLLEALIHRAWVPMDPTNKQREMGWAPPVVSGSATYAEGEGMGYGLGQPAPTVIPEGTSATVTSPFEIFQKLVSGTIPLLERYGVLRPRTYTPEGRPIYVQPLPVRATTQAFAYQQLTRPVSTPLGTVTQGQLLLIGAGAFVGVMFLMPRGGRRRR